MGILYIVTTPIGNLDDITIRAIKTLFSVDIIACEDTRRAGQLMHELHARYDKIITVENPTEDKFIRYDNQKEMLIVPELIDLLQKGKNIALISDAGTPLIADPGYRLVVEARKRAIYIEAIPGPTAFTTALSIAGLATHQCTFLGYLPEKTSHREKILTEIKTIAQTNKYITPTYACYCAPHKLEQTLKDMLTCLGNISITIARELTKIHEEVWTGTLDEACARWTDPKGEFVLLFNLTEK